MAPALSRDPRNDDAATPGAAPIPGAPGAARRVARGVIEGLGAGRFAPGQRLIEADLCLRFGVGRNTVREALQQLASEGVVRLSRHKGATIRELSVAEAIQTLEVTELLTGLAARGAARNIDAPGAAAQVRDAIEQLRAARPALDDRPFAEARRAFYEALFHLSGNHELQRISPTVQVHVVRAQYHLTPIQRRLHDDYEATGAAVLAGDEDRAEACARGHVRRVRASLRDAL